MLEQAMCNPRTLRWLIVGISVATILGMGGYWINRVRAQPQALSPLRFEIGSTTCGGEIPFSISVPNRTDRRVRVEAVQANCACTELRFDPASVEPGAAVKITGVQRTMKHIGSFEKSFVLRWTDGRQQEVILKAYAYSDTVSDRAVGVKLAGTSWTESATLVSEDRSPIHITGWTVSPGDQQHPSTPSSFSPQTRETATGVELEIKIGTLAEFPAGKFDWRLDYTVAGKNGSLAGTRSFHVSGVIAPQVVAEVDSISIGPTRFASLENYMKSVRFYSPYDTDFTVESARFEGSSGPCELVLKCRDRFVDLALRRTPQAENRDVSFAIDGILNVFVRTNDGRPFQLRLPVHGVVTE